MRQAKIPANPRNASCGIAVSALAFDRSAVLPGVQMLPIASLAVVPFWAGAVVPYTKGNVVKTVIVLLIYMIPFMYFATWTVTQHTLAFQNMGQFAEQIGQGLQLGSWDVGGDILGFIIQSVFRLFGVNPALGG